VTRELLAAGLKLMAAAYSRQVDQNTAEAYWQLCRAIPDEAWIEAVKDACRSEEFMPRPATIIRYARATAKAHAERLAVTDRRRLAGGPRTAPELIRPILERYMGARPALPPPPKEGPE